MGQGVIVSSQGESLYTIRLTYSLTALNAELAMLQLADAEYATLLLRAFLSRDLLADDAAITREAMNAIIQQWQEAVIAKGDEEPPPIPPGEPNDPETGAPWVNPDRAQEAPLLALINAARTAASVATVSRDSDLDVACLAHLRDQAGTGREGHSGSDRSQPMDRANRAGYYSPATLFECLAYGPSTPAAVMSRWQGSSAVLAQILSTEVTQAGVSHVYSSTHPGSYLWAVLLASAQGAAVTVTIEPDPIKTAAEETETALDTIKAPKVADTTPEKLGEAVRLFALAQNKALAADREVARLMAEKLVRQARIDELQAIKTAAETPVSAWAYRWNTTLQPGEIVATVEVPQWWRPESAAPAVTTMGVRGDPEGNTANVTVSYTESPINIVDASLGETGQLHHAETLSAESVFVNAALEPGHLKWKPLWRYGVITTLAETCSVTLESVAARPLPGRPFDPVMALDDTLILTNVPISYPPCNAEAFEVGDAVLVLFEGYQRDHPKVVGFRREPRPCLGGRTSWTSF